MSSEILTPSFSLSAEVEAIAKRLQSLSELEDYPPRRTVEAINVSIPDIRRTCLTYWELLKPFKTEERSTLSETEEKALDMLLDYRRDHPEELAEVNRIFAEYPFQYPFGLGSAEESPRDIFIEWLAQAHSFARDAALWATRPNELRQPNPFLQRFAMQSASYTNAAFCQIDGEERMMIHIPVQVTSEGKEIRGQVACLTFGPHGLGDQKVICIHNRHGECKDANVHSVLFQPGN